MWFLNCCISFSQQQTAQYKKTQNEGQFSSGKSDYKYILNIPSHFVPPFSLQQHMLGKSTLNIKIHPFSRVWLE